MGEAQHVGLAVAQDFQQQPGLALPGTGAGVVGVGQPDQHAVAEQADQRVADVGAIASRPCSRARLAWWISARSASAIWAGQTASG